MFTESRIQSRVQVTQLFQQLLTLVQRQVHENFLLRLSRVCRPSATASNFLALTRTVSLAELIP
jgi:hypothetical protein